MKTCVTSWGEGPGGGHGTRRRRLSTAFVALLLRLQVLWLLGNLAADSGLASEFIVAGGASAISATVRRLAQRPSEDATLLVLVTLSALARHNRVADALSAQGAVSATAKCIAAGSQPDANGAAVVEAGCSALTLLLATSTPSASLSVELQECGALPTLTAVLAGCEGGLRAHGFGSSGSFDIDLTLQAAQALQAVLKVLHAVAACAPDGRADVDSAEAGAADVARSLLRAASTVRMFASRAGAPELEDALHAISSAASPAGRVV